MIYFKTQVFLFSIFYTLLTILQSTITTTITPLESQPQLDDVVNQFIGQDIKSNETLLNEVKMAIDHVWLEKEHQELELRRKDETIDTKFKEWCLKEVRIRNKLKYFFRALSIYKAGALIDLIEERIQSNEPQLCDRCLKWGYPETNCTDVIPRFYAYDNGTREIKEGIYKQMNHWYWTLEHCRDDDTHIGCLVTHLEEIYRKPNLTSTLFTPEEKPENFEQFKLTFCLALMQIQHWRYNEQEPYFNDYFLEQLNVKKICIDKYIEIFFRALGKWVNFEEYVLQRGDDNLTADTMATIELDTEVNKILNVFIGESIRKNETLFNEVKKAIEHILSEKQRLQIQVSIKNQFIRSKTKEIEGDFLEQYETKIKTISDELWIYKITRRIKKPHYNESDKKTFLLCSNCLTRNHTADNCNTSKVTFGGDDSISSDVFNWYRMLEHPERDFEIKFLLKTLREQYDSGNFTRKLKPRPKNFQHFKLIFCKVLDEIHRYVQYSALSRCNQPQWKEYNFYGVPLYEYAILAFMGNEFPDELALIYDYEASESDSESDSSSDASSRSFEW